MLTYNGRRLLEHLLVAGESDPKQASRLTSTLQGYWIFHINSRYRRTNIIYAHRLWVHEALVVYSTMRSFKKRAASLSMHAPISTDDYYSDLGCASDHEGFVFSIPSFAESDSLKHPNCNLRAAGSSENKNLFDDWRHKLLRKVSFTVVSSVDQCKFSIRKTSKFTRPDSMASIYLTPDECSSTKNKDPLPQRHSLLSRRRRLPETLTASSSSAASFLEPDTGRARPPAPYFYARPIVHEHFEEYSKIMSPADKEFHQSRPVLLRMDQRKSEQTRDDARQATGELDNPDIDRFAGVVVSRCLAVHI